MVEGSIYYWYHRAGERLRDLVDYPRREALLLCEHCFGLSGRAELNLREDEFPAAEAVDKLNRAIDERSRRPLQYILGEWPFMGRSFAVGEGVLCPRDDTQALVEAALCYIRKNAQDKVNIIDLCAGSGIVGLSLVQECKFAYCTLVELSEDAIKHLNNNVLRYGCGRTEILNADILNPPRITAEVDIIVSNPPYIPTKDIEALAREVRQEPRMALDGGEDGLVFYRAILRHWLPILRPGGLLATEIGFDQAEQVAGMFTCCGLCGVETQTDISGNARVIYGTKAMSKA